MCAAAADSNVASREAVVIVIFPVPALVIDILIQIQQELLLILWMIVIQPEDTRLHVLNTDVRPHVLLRIVLGITVLIPKESQVPFTSKAKGQEMHRGGWGERAVRWDMVRCDDWSVRRVWFFFPADLYMAGMTRSSVLLIS